MALLEIRGVTKRFGGVLALDGVSLDVAESEIVGLIGPNGAGKTTLFNCITGFDRPNAGAIQFRGHDLTALRPHERAALGLGRSFQQVGLIRGQTVLANLLTAQHMTAGYGALGGLLASPDSLGGERQLARRTEAILEFTGLAEHRARQVDGLPYGILKNLELAAVLATDPILMMLDEPGSGLSPTQAAAVGQILLRLRRELGLTILLIEHHVPLVMGVCDFVYVLNFGGKIAEGPPEIVRAHPEVVAAFLGEPPSPTGSAPFESPRPDG
ncbi:MAG: ABC transporter ATP-binding protein [Actinomycetota bacterium]